MTRVFRPDRRGWRALKACCAIAAATAAGGALIVGDEPNAVPMYAAHVYLASPALDRDTRTLTMTVEGGGYCAGYGQHDEEARFDHMDVDDDNDAIQITAWIRNQPGVDDDTMCAGVGGPGFGKRVELSAPVGDRALISRTYPAVPKRVLALPHGDAGDRFSAPEYSYEGRDCRAARPYFAGEPQEWCARLW